MTVDRLNKNNVITSILPKPMSVESGCSDFEVSSKSKIVFCGEESERVSFALQILTEMFAKEDESRLPLMKNGNADGYKLLITNNSDVHTGSISSIGAKHLGHEGYTLEVNKELACVQSPTVEGFSWGLMTLRQLIVCRHGIITIYGVSIKDKPHYRWRGFQIDSGRSPNSLAKIKRIIRICSAFKLNFMIFREGDDEFNAVRYQTNKLGSTNPYAFSIDEVKELVEYAYLHGISVIPEIESLGHSTAKGFHYPELVNNGFEEFYSDICVHIRKSNLLPCDRRTYNLLKSMYSEWLPFLKSPFIHLGIDEVRLDKEIQSQHFEGLLAVVDDLAQKCNKTIMPIIWSDGPVTPNGYQDRVIRCLWSYADEQDVGFTEHLLNQGIDKLSAVGCSEGVFMAGGSASNHQPYTKSSDKEAFYNLASWAKWGREHPNFIGLFAVQWSGNMIDDWLPDYVAAAEFGWHPPVEIRNYEEWLEQMQSQLMKLEDVNNPKATEVDPPAWDGIWLKEKHFTEDIRKNSFIDESSGLCNSSGVTH